MKYSEGLSFVSVGARPLVLKGELVNESLKGGARPFEVQWRALLCKCRSSSACVEGRARQNERLGLWSEQLGSSLQVQELVRLC